MLHYAIRDLVLDKEPLAVLEKQDLEDECVKQHNIKYHVGNIFNKNSTRHIYQCKRSNESVFIGSTGDVPKTRYLELY